MDTPMHALAVPDADRSTLKRPKGGARAARSDRRRADGTCAGERCRDRRQRAGAASPRRKAARRGRPRPHPRTGRAAISSASCTPAISSSPTTPRRCPPACAARMRRAAPRSRCGSPAVDRSMPGDVRDFSAIVFGAGDFHIPTERRPLPPPLARGDRLDLGPLAAIVTRTLDHPRLVSMRIRWHARCDLGRHRAARPADSVRAHAGAARAVGRVDRRLRVRRSRSSRRPPDSRSTGRPSPRCVRGASTSRRLPMRRASHRLATRRSTRACRSTSRTAFPLRPRSRSISARAAHRRIVAVGTTVVRALEHAAADGRPIRSGPGLATGRIAPSATLHVVDAILSGVHEPSTSHYQLLGAFAREETLKRADAMMTDNGYRTHEFGDSVLVERERVSIRGTCAESARRRSFASAPA